MKKTLRNTLVAALTITLVSWALAVNDDGGGGGGTYTQRTAEESRQLLNDYREQRDAPAATEAPSYGMSAGNASQVSMSYGALHEPSLYSGSAGNASQLSNSAGDTAEAAIPTAERWAEYVNTGNAEAAAELHTADAIFINPVGQVVEGREAILSYAQEGIDAGVELSVEVMETEVLSDTAYQVNSFTVMDAEGDILAQGYAQVILHRVDGEWRWHRHFSNMILPEFGANDLNGSD